MNVDTRFTVCIFGKNTRQRPDACFPESIGDTVHGNGIKSRVGVQHLFFIQRCGIIGYKKDASF